MSIDRNFKDVMGSVTKEGQFPTAERTWAKYNKDVAKIRADFDLKTIEGAKKAVGAFVESFKSSGSLDDFRKKEFEMKSPTVRAGLLSNFKEAEGLVIKELRKNVFKEGRLLTEGGFKEKVENYLNEEKFYDKKDKNEENKPKKEDFLKIARDTLNNYIGSFQKNVYQEISKLNKDAFKVSGFNELTEQEFVNEDNKLHIFNKLVGCEGKVDEAIDAVLKESLQSFFSSDKEEANNVLNKSMGIAVLPSCVKKEAPKPTMDVVPPEVVADALKETIKEEVPEASAAIESPKKEAGYTEYVQERFHAMCEFLRGVFNFLFSSISQEESTKRGNDLADVFSKKLQFLYDVASKMGLVAKEIPEAILKEIDANEAPSVGIVEDEGAAIAKEMEKKKEESAPPAEPPPPAAPTSPPVNPEADKK